MVGDNPPIWLGKFRDFEVPNQVFSYGKKLNLGYNFYTGAQLTGLSDRTLRMSEKSQDQLRPGHLADFQPGGDLLKSPLPRKRGFIGVVKSLVIFFLAIWLFLDSAALAKPTTADQAQHLVRFWLAHHNNRPLDTLLGSQIKEIKIFRDNAGDILYFVISLSPDGFVIIPGDDLVEPIIAFAPSRRI